MKSSLPSLAGLGLGVIVAVVLVARPDRPAPSPPPRPPSEALPASGPAIRVRVVSAPVGGQPGDISLEIERSRIPGGAALELDLVAADGDRHGGAGPLMLVPQRIGGSGRADFVWNGRQTGCAPADAPMWCDLRPGRYRVRARVYDHGDFNLFGIPVPVPSSGPLPPLPPKVIAEHVSEPILVRGA